MSAFDDSDWDGSPSNWETAEAYCQDCLIDENPKGEPKTKDHCHLPFRKPGSRLINRSALRTMASGRGLLAVKASSESKRKAAKWIIRQWPKAFKRPAPDSIYRIAGLDAPTKMGFYKVGDDVWFFGIYSNNFEDKDGEILSLQAHREFISWAKEKNIKPPIVLFHQPKFPVELHILALLMLESEIISSDQYNQFYQKLYDETLIATTEHIFEIDGMAIVIGKVKPDRISYVERMQQTNLIWGMSHGFLVFSNDSFNDSIKSGNIINKYRTYEFTIAPIKRVANLATLAEFINKGVIYGK